MSVAFAPLRQRAKGDITPAGIQKLLDENNQLIQCIMDFQSKGKTAECSHYQQMLHRNLVYLATIADSNQNMQSLLPAVSIYSQILSKDHVWVFPHPTASHGPGPNQTPSIPSGSMNMPPSSHGTIGAYNHTVPSSQGIQSQGQMNMSQGQPMGNYGPRPNINIQPNQGPMMHQQAPSQQYNMAPSAGSGQHFQGQQNPMGIMGQGNHVLGQRPMPPYRPPHQGPPQQYPGQEEYYTEQYSHGGQGAPEGSAQYGQQQEAYQQGPAQQQQAYPPQQQYTGQQGYPGQQQAYGPSQGTPSQYPNYPQSQGQQYTAYRPPQPGPPQGQPQRPYAFEQTKHPNYENLSSL
uniref:SS18 subunit of BAF chromatin remodeling complex n=1 Tax=Sinocyclocheilus rhinocerous TaxID=307959 RepID=A0A673HLB3_9TELE